MRQKTKFWLAVDEDGTAFIYDRIPWREKDESGGYWTNDKKNGHNARYETAESIKYDLYRDMTWKDEPVKLIIIFPGAAQE